MNLFNLVATLSLDTSKYKQELDEAQAKGKSFASGLKTIDSGLTRLSKITIAAGAAMLGLSSATLETQRDLAKLATNAKLSGNSLELMTDSMGYLNAVTGETDSNVEALSNLMQANLTDNQMQQALDGLAGAVIAFPDTLKIEGLADGLQETIATGKGMGQFGELLERSGVNLEVFNAEMATAQTQAERTDIALKYLAGTGMTEVNDAFKENNKTLIANEEANYKLQTTLAELGAAISPITIQLTNLASAVLPVLAKIIEENSTGIIILGGTILGLTAAVKGILIINNVITALKAFKLALVANNVATKALAVATKAMAAAQKLFNAALKANPIMLVVGIITTLIAAYVAFSKENEELNKKLSELGNKFMEIFSTILDAITPIYTAVAEIGMKLVNALMPAFEAVTPIIMIVIDLISKILSALSPIITMLAETIAPIVEALLPVFDTTFSAIAKIIEFVAGVIEGVVGIISDLFKLLTGQFELTVEQIDKAIAKGKEFNKYTDGQTVAAIAQQGYSSATYIPRNALGTEDWVGGLTYVNEGMRGEIINLPSGTQIIPNDISRIYAREAGQISSSTESAEVANLIYQILVILQNDVRAIEIIKKGLQQSELEVSVEGREFGRLVKQYA